MRALRVVMLAGMLQCAAAHAAPVPLSRPCAVSDWRGARSVGRLYAVFKLGKGGVHRQRQFASRGVHDDPLLEDD
jgi:hypothetical protein